jgi:hypothetical protein
MSESASTRAAATALPATKNISDFGNFSSAVGVMTNVGFASMDGRRHRARRQKGIWI